MTSSSSTSTSDSSSCSDDDSSDRQHLLDEISSESSRSAEITQNLAETIAMYIPIVTTTMTHCKGMHGGSTVGRRYIHRERESRYHTIINDYFKGQESKYTPELFRRRFRMDINLFNRILDAIGKKNKIFTHRFDGFGKKGVSPLQKMIAAIRMLAYGCSADNLDEYVQIGESTAIESLMHFCDSVIAIFEEKYLRKPNEDDIKMLLKEGEKRGFPGMLGSLDCMHWHWKNCPTSWHGTHTNGFKKVPTLILEAVASQNLWIWHAFFGMAGTHNDITVLDRSPLFDDIVHGRAPPCNFEIEGNRYNMGYYLTDGIYPEYATLIQTISQPTSVKEKIFAKQQEAVRKDVERAFGVLQSRWHIIKGPSRMWKDTDLKKIIKTCIILHNMIIESEREQGIDPERWESPPNENAARVELEHDYAFLVSNMIGRITQIRNTCVHKKLKNDLINHLWKIYGDREM